MNKSEQKRTFFFTVLFFGGLWGLVEATLGYFLHMLPELLPIPPISGLILFPIGLFFMVKAKRYTDRTAAIPLTALVAAMVKLASSAVPFIAFRFVRNPALAILLEGVTVWFALGVSEWKLNFGLPVKALVMSFGWRALFLATNILFGLSGIANKPIAMQRRFVYIDGSLDAAIIVIAVIGAWAFRSFTNRKFKRPVYGPVSALVAVLAGIGGQVLFAGL